VLPFPPSTFLEAAMVAFLSISFFLSSVRAAGEKRGEKRERERERGRRKIIIITYHQIFGSSVPRCRGWRQVGWPWKREELGGMPRSSPGRSP